MKVATVNKCKVISIGQNYIVSKYFVHHLEYKLLECWSADPFCSK